MSRFLTFIFLLLSLPSLATVQGWVCVVELSEFRCDVGGTNPDGSTFYVGQYTGRKARFEKYLSGSTRPSLADFGTDYYRDLAGNPKPTRPFTFAFVMWEVSGFQSFVVNDSYEDSDLSGLGNLLRDKVLSPVYVASANDPYSFTLSDGHYMGVYSPFGANGSLNIVQGAVGPSNSAVPNGYYYDPNNGALIITDSPNANMGTFSWDSVKGEYVYTPAVQSSGDINLTPVVSAIETQGGLTRSQLVDLLGSSGNSWVYDCKLSLSQLYDLAVGSGLCVRPDFSDSSLLGDVRSLVNYSDSILNMEDSILTALNSKDFSPTINVSSPDVNVNVDTSGLASQSTLSDLYTYIKNTMGTNVGNIKIFNQNINSLLTTVKNILSGWDNTAAPSFSAPSGYDVTDENDGLPVGLKSFYADDSPTSVGSTVQRLGDYVSWGDSGAPHVFNLDFLSGFLTSIIGSVPSVGSDPVMFDFDVDIPYLGHIQRRYSWADFPYIGDFRSFLVWVLYLVFGLACFKLLHKTLI